MPPAVISSDPAALLDHRYAGTPVFQQKIMLERSWAPGTGRHLMLLMKRMADLVGALLILILLSPMFLLISVAIGLTSRGPLLYKSLRIGKDKRPFYMYKFRTMVQDADRQLADMRQEARERGQLFKLKTDARVTPVGRFLRQYSLDEFPQLLNVLRGEMSLVGPRPYIPEESDMFQPPYTARFDVMPGMTGLWQVSGRSDLSFEELCKLDYTYATAWNPWMDVQLLFKTMPSILLKKGAY